MKKILFVINTLGWAGAETALLELLRRLDAEEYEISLYGNHLIRKLFPALILLPFIPFRLRN